MRKVRAVPKMLKAMRAAPRGFRRLAAIGAASENALRDADGWYLEALGVRSAQRGLGIGAGLMTAHLAELDRSGEAAWVETSDRRNLSFYQRFGFEVRDTYAPLPAGPAYSVLRRQ